MKKILYLHGFSSAGSTGTATNLRNHLYQDYGVTVVSPDIPLSPLQAVDFLKTLADAEQPDLIMGSSMGGMYTELLHGFLRIAVNPSFHMAKLLTFKHLNKNVVFQNPRADGQTAFKVDKTMVNEFREIEQRLSLRPADASDRDRVWGVFGREDKTVNNQKEFTAVYNPSHALVIDGGHSLTDAMIKRDVLPLIKRLLNL